MTAIVCTMGLLIALVGIERLDILRGLYETVYLPLLCMMRSFAEDGTSQGWMPIEKQTG